MRYRSAEQMLWDYRLKRQELFSHLIDLLKKFPDNTAFMIDKDPMYCWIKLSDNRLSYTTVSMTRLQKCTSVNDAAVTNAMLKIRRLNKAISKTREIMLERIRKLLFEQNKGNLDCLKWTQHKLIINNRFWRIEFDGYLQLEVVQEPTPDNNERVTRLDV